MAVGSRSDPDERAQSCDFETRGRRSVAWTMVRSGGDQFVSFLVFLVLARILSKAEIGTFALAYVFAEIGRYLASAGVAQLIARARSVNALFLDTIFWTNVILAASYCLLLSVIAQFASGIFDAPSLDRVLQWMTLAVIFNALGNTHLALRLRDFGHSTLAVRALVAGILGGAAALVAAFSGAGVWSLVVQRIVYEAVGAILAWHSYPQWQPRLRFDLSQARSNLPFGLHLAGANLATFLTVRAQDLVIGKAIGPAAVSIYRVAWRPIEVFGSTAVSSYSIVALQIFSRLRDSPDELRSAYSAMLRRSALLSVPVLVGYGLLGPWLVPLLFGPQWSDAGRIAPALMVLAIPLTLSAFVRALLPALGHVKQQRQLALLDLATTAALTALTVGYGLFWVAIAYSAKSYLFLPLQLRLMRQTAGIGLTDAIAPFGIPVLAAAVMCLAIVPASYVLDMGNLFALGAVCTVGAVLYALVISMFLPEEVRSMLKYLGMNRKT